MAYDMVLGALADATRRSMLENLRSRPMAVGEMAQRLGVSQPAVSQHLRVLEQANLVSYRAFGRRKVYALSIEGLAPLRSYLEAFWGEVLDAFAADDPAPPAPASGGSPPVMSPLTEKPS